MSVQQNFRTAIGGFKKEDVVKYIEYINAKHAAQVGQLKTELQNLQQELQELQSAVPAEDLSEKVTELEQRCAAAEQERMLPRKIGVISVTEPRKYIQRTALHFLHLLGTFSDDLIDDGDSLLVPVVDRDGATQIQALELDIDELSRASDPLRITSKHHPPHVRG